MRLKLKIKVDEKNIDVIALLNSGFEVLLHSFPLSACALTTFSMLSNDLISFGIRILPLSSTFNINSNFPSDRRNISY
ncbi:MAG: hypothetical protein JHC19_04855 [Desulfurococcaceae archaeon]|nr:hypothetical protein [Desulfurococcaceae archaeon]